MTAPGSPSLKQRVLRASGWTFSGHVAGQALRLGGNLAMTRILVPDMFGVVAIATMVSVILSMLSDIGLRQSIIQNRRGAEPAFLDTAWTLQILRGFAMWMTAVALSVALWLANRAGLVPPDSTYAAPVLPLVIAVNAFSAVILGFQSAKVASAHRQLDHRRIVQCELAGQGVGLVAMIVLGIQLRTVWALVAGGLLGALVTTVLGHFLLPGRRDRFGWDADAIRELIGFGRWAFVSSAFTVLAANGDRLLLGGLVTADVLGIYAIAILMVAAVEGALGKLSTAVSLPALSEIARNEPARLREVYYRLRVPTDLVLLFAAGFLHAAGRAVIELLYDARYAAAGGMLEVLALSLITARYGVAYQIYLAVGNPRYMAIIQIVRAVALFTTVPLAYHLGGLSAALWAIALHGVAMIPFVHGFNARLGLNDFRRELQVLAALPAGYLCGWAGSALVR
jgi:O-antigen/teichoic acid export membrane protein